MKPVRLPASATNALPRWGLFVLCLLYILSGLIGRDPWKNEDAAGFGIMWTMANGNWQDWLLPHIVGLPMPQHGPLAYWIGAISIRLFGWLIGDVMAARVATVFFFLVGSLAVWYSAYLLGRRNEAQPLRLAFGGQPEPKDYGRTLADGALLIYLGSLGLLIHSHSTSANALYVSMTACTLYTAICFFENNSSRMALALGVVLGLLTLTHGWVVPLTLWLGLVVFDIVRTRTLGLRLLLLTLPAALLVAAAWVVTSELLRPFNRSPIDGWMAWNLSQLNVPTLPSLKYLFLNGIWFSWPAWPFAAWAIYAWRKQFMTLHIAVPFVFAIAIGILALIGPHSEAGVLLPLLPPLAILAAFGLPTMKRGAINAVDWFSVMILTACAGFIWIGWIAKQTGWPAQIAKNAFKLAPGFKPEFNFIAVAIAALASVGWMLLVHWRLARRPSVLWRAVVLSSGGVILCWLLLMTLWLPWGNYMRSYAAVAREITMKVPPQHCIISSSLGAPQRASFAYFGNLRFAGFDDARCAFLLVQGSRRSKNAARQIQYAGQRWELIWEGQRASDRSERFRLYQRID